MRQELYLKVNHDKLLASVKHQTDGFIQRLESSIEHQQLLEKQKQDTVALVVEVLKLIQENFAVTYKHYTEIKKDSFVKIERIEADSDKSEVSFEYIAEAWGQPRKHLAFEIKVDSDTLTLTVNGSRSKRTMNLSDGTDILAVSGWILARIEAEAVFRVPLKDSSEASDTWELDWKFTKVGISWRATNTIDPERWVEIKNGLFTICAENHPDISRVMTKLRELESGNEPCSLPSISTAGVFPNPIGGELRPSGNQHYGSRS